MALFPEEAYWSDADWAAHYKDRLTAESARAEAAEREAIHLAARADTAIAEARGMQAAAEQALAEAKAEINRWIERLHEKQRDHVATAQCLLDTAKERDRALAELAALKGVCSGCDGSGHDYDGGSVREGCCPTCNGTGHTAGAHTGTGEGE